MNERMNFSKRQKIVILSLLCVIIVGLLYVLTMPSSGDGSRTVMIYIVGSNLETDGAIVSADIDSIDPHNIDLGKTNILLYTGGTKQWHNFVSNQDNGLYILKNNGFEKLVSDEQYSMGDPSTLTRFLKYGYDNYKASKYDLILYDHGGAIDGAIYDDLSNDNLSLADLKKALTDSPFNENNKLDAVLFRTCLNSTIEVANIFKPFSNYLIASEEVSYGSSKSSVLDFLNNVVKTDKGLEFGSKFLSSYEKQMDMMDPIGSLVVTYAVIDLSKIDKINKELDEYISGIDLNTNYGALSKIRAQLYQYGRDSANYDMIDLYDFVSKTSDLSTKNNQALLNAIKDAVKYNNTNSDSSHGLSIYFPFHGTKPAQNMYLSAVYSKLDFSPKYKEFITAYNKVQKEATTSAYSYSFSKDQIDTKNSEYEVSINLSDDQIKNYSFSTFTIFARDPEHPNYYKPLYNTDEVTLSNNGKLTANYENKILVAYDEEDGHASYVYTMYRKNGNMRSTYGVIYNTELSFGADGYSEGAMLYFANNTAGKPVISAAKYNSSNERLDGILIDLKDFNYVEMLTASYRILDEDGNVLVSSEWESAPVYTGVGVALDEEFGYSSLDDADNYYALFMVTDINGNVNYSELIKVGG